MRPLPVIALVLAVLPVAFCAEAQTAPARWEALAAAVRPAALPVAQTAAVRIITMLPSAVNHSFDPDRRVTGSAGLLCGLKPTADTHGINGSYGPDPDGKFVGAKLSLAF